jgi:hypothetical protein
MMTDTTLHESDQAVETSLGDDFSDFSEPGEDLTEVEKLFHAIVHALLTEEGEGADSAPT